MRSSVAYTLGADVEQPDPDRQRQHHCTGNARHVITGNSGNTPPRRWAGADTAAYTHAWLSPSFTLQRHVDGHAGGAAAPTRYRASSSSSTAAAAIVLIDPDRPIAASPPWMRRSRPVPPPGDTLVFAAAPTGSTRHRASTDDVRLHDSVQRGDDDPVPPPATAHITTGDGDDIVVTGTGDDTIKTGGGNDIVQTGGGDDTIIGGSGNGDDVYDGGAAAIRSSIRRPPTASPSISRLDDRSDAGGKRRRTRSARC